ncbi:hypothetical protein V1264_008674 [Littorina saxatilis]|uniref:Uncharacterized protein n=1 Tax=Littorina saxatilis TaxID=31220 RepID=A0AAN9ATK0_9CAEN
MVLDFAENYTCTYQNEVQAAHWHKSSVTLHPIVTYYACPKGCGEAVTESLAFVSNNTVHDFNAVHHFTKMAVEHLTGTRGLCLQRIITWTDGCASQYKSKGPFADISHVFQDYMKLPLSAIILVHVMGRAPQTARAQSSKATPSMTQRLAELTSQLQRICTTIARRLHSTSSHMMRISAITSCALFSGWQREKFFDREAAKSRH